MNIDKKFNFPPDIEAALLHLDTWPRTEPGVVPGYPNAFFIVSPSEMDILSEIISDLDQVTSDEFESWNEETKYYYSAILNNADRVLNNSISYSAKEDFERC